MQEEASRRKVLAMLGASLLSSGCVPMATMNSSLVKKESDYTGPIEDFYQSKLTDPTRGPFQNPYKSIGTFNAEQTARSIRAFEAMDKGYMIRTLDLPTVDQLNFAAAAFDKVRAKYADKKELALSESMEVTQSMIPMLRMYFDIHAHDGKESSLSGSGSEFGLSPSGTIRIPSGHRITVVQRGYCLDQELRAPSRDEVLTLQPVAKLVPDEMLPLFNAVLALGNIADKRAMEPYQKALWTIRSAGEANGLAGHVEPSTLKLMEKAMPGGADAFVKFHNQQVAKTGGAPIKNTANLSTPTNTDNVAQKMFQGFMDGLTKSKPAPDDKKIDNRNFQELGNNVHSFSVGNDVLTPQIEIANAGAKDIYVNLRDYVMQPQRMLQRIAMAPTRLSSLRERVYPMVVDKLQLATLDNLKNLADKHIDVIARFLTGKTLMDLSRSKVFQDMAFRLIANKDVVKKVVELMPLLGSELCLYEAVTGKNWLTGDDLNTFERVGSALGTIPGSTVFKSTLGQLALSRAKWLFLGLGVEANMGYMDGELAYYAKNQSNPLDALPNAFSLKIMKDTYRSIYKIPENQAIPLKDRQGFIDDLKPLPPFDPNRY